MTTRPGIDQTHMSKVLTRELDDSKQLLQLLATEKTAITDRDISAFEEAIDMKRSLLERLARHEQ